MNIKPFTSSPASGVADSVWYCVLRWRRILSVTPRWKYTRIRALVYGNSGPLPNTIIIGSTPYPQTPRGPSPSRPPGGTRWGSCVSIFRKHFRARIWLIGKLESTQRELIIKTKTHYAYLIPRRRRVRLQESTVSWLYARAGAIIFTPQKRGRARWIAPLAPLGEYESWRKRPSSNSLYDYNNLYNHVHAHTHIKQIYKNDLCVGIVHCDPTEEVRGVRYWWKTKYIMRMQTRGSIVVYCVRRYTLK